MAGGSDAVENTGLSCARCGKPAHLQCPKCVQLKLPREDAAFCERNLGLPNDGWLYCLRKGQSQTPKLPHFDWTGPLRPYPISQKRFVPNHIDQPDWTIDGIPKIEPNSDLQHVVEIAREVLDAAARIVRPGITTDEIDAVFHEATISAVNEVICHGIPDARILEDGDIVNVDVTVYYKGVHADLNETYFVGNVDEASKRLVQCTYECLDKAIAAENKAVGVMKAGQTFTIEPMINSGVWRDRTWPDGWTSVTSDGKRSAQFEHTRLVTYTGVEVLSARLPSSPKVFPWVSP
ncbi:hypothetical protein SASPL_103928 [Salvia splendens]|uniref:Peptidase M24 domain-containing protein n=1 Tax=Salvia splendens TaxID=180675 RepID=A0A8X8YKN4_SALSN|nr:hypothetical protein SASPL_103928 [Salvia splendens]